MITTTLESPVHAPAIEALLDAAFGDGRQRKISYRFRRGVAALATACIVAIEQGVVVGCARAWPVTIGEDGEGVLIGPVAVAASHRRLGLGAALVETCLAAAAAQDIGTAVLVGEPGYYARFGFTLASASDIVIPGENPVRVQAMALQQGRSMASGLVTPWRLDRRLAA